MCTVRSHFILGLHCQLESEHLCKQVCLPRAIFFFSGLFISSGHMMSALADWRACVSRATPAVASQVRTLAGREGASLNRHEVQGISSKEGRHLCVDGGEAGAEGRE